MLTTATPAVAVPGWLLAGVLVGGLVALLIVVAFLAGERLFPTARRASGDEQVRGERLRREEIRYYLRAIDEAFEEDATVEGRAVAFSLTDRDVAVTFDARTYLLLRESGVHPVLVEHEMPGVHLGTRLPFETPDLGFGADDPRGWDETRTRTRAAAGGVDDARDRRDGREAGPTPAADRESLRTAYAVLGLPPAADAETVRATYRKRVKEVHPDQGGDPEAFQRLQEAYATIEDHADDDGAGVGSA